MKLLKIFLPIFVLSLLLFLTPKFVLASNLYLSPGGGKVSSGGTINVQVRLNAGGDAVNGVSAFLAYPQDKLQVAWISYGGSAFGIQAESSFGGGVIKISRGNFAGVGGNVNVATIAFRGKSLGNATVSFIGGSNAPRASDSSNSLNLGASAGGVFNVVAGVPQPTKGAGIDTPTTPADSTGPVISDLTVEEVSTSSATISWKTDKEADSYLEYGLDKDHYILNTSNGNLTTDHKLKIENPLLLAGSSFHFRVKSKDNFGNQTASEDKIFRLTGYKVKVKVSDLGDKPLPGTEVLLYSYPERGSTDASGEVIFENVMPGKHLLVVKTQYAEKTAEIEVLESSEVQLFEVKVDSAAVIQSLIEGKVINKNYLYPLAAVIFIGMIALSFILRRRKIKPKEEPKGV